MVVPVGTEVVVAVRDVGAEDPSVPLAEELAAALGLPVRVLHVEVESAKVAAAITDGLSPQSILVIHSEHASRWSGKWSVAEHVIDQWGGIVIAIGPRFSGTLQPGSVMAAVDGSTDSLRAIGPAQIMGEVLEQPVEHCNVAAVAAENSRATPDRPFPVPTTVLVGNDPISALLSHAEEVGCAMVVLAARGDRHTARSSISRTSSGMIAGAVQPVMIVGTQWVQPGAVA